MLIIGTILTETCHVPVIDLYNQFGWDLYKKYGHAYDAFKLIVSYVLPSYCCICLPPLLSDGWMIVMRK
jgi:hypothetical protein